MIDKQYHLDWVKAFCEGFYEGYEEHDSNYKLKLDHTIRVCDNGELIYKTLDLETNLEEICWLSCLFHDLGRFPQYSQYRTFKDSISVNHGLLSSKIIEDKGLLKVIDEPLKDAVIQAVRFHNAYQEPNDLTDMARVALKLVRDADKLDIWKVFIDNYSDPDKKKPSALGLGFPDEPFISQSIIDSIKRQQIVKLSDVVTLNDFKLLQLSWVFDLNFEESYRQFAQRQYLDALLDTVTAQQGLDECIAFIKGYLNDCL